MYPALKRVAKRHGYALAVHGSLIRDFDLIAAPWVENCSSEEILIEAIRARIGGLVSSDTTKEPAIKPHGRRAWSIVIGQVTSAHGGWPFLDISVMPKKETV